MLFVLPSVGRGFEDKMNDTFFIKKN